MKSVGETIVQLNYNREEGDTEEVRTVVSIGVEHASESEVLSSQFLACRGCAHVCASPTLFLLEGSFSTALHKTT